MNTRAQKGRALAERLKIERLGALWIVPSSSGNSPYTVNVDSVPPYCSCPDYDLRGVKCKHIYAVEYLIQQETARETCVERETVCAADGTATVTETVTETVTQTTTTRKRVTYRQDWPAYNAAQTHEKAHFQELLHALCQGIPDLPRVPGPGRPRLPLGEMIFAARLGLDRHTASRHLRALRNEGLIDSLDRPLAPTSGLRARMTLTQPPLFPPD